MKWSGSDLDLVLHDPIGNYIGPEAPVSDPNIDFLEGGIYEKYTILDPASGEWTMEVRAIDVPAGGEEYVAIAFTNELRGDLTSDTHVDFKDVAALAVHWMAQDCTEPDWCAGSDFGNNGSVDISDLGFLANDWLKGNTP